MMKPNCLYPLIVILASATLVGCRCQLSARGDKCDCCPQCVDSCCNADGCKPDCCDCDDCTCK